jgi:hypothetical protein
MPSAEARVETERSSRYLVQLCQHAAAMDGPHGHRLATHRGDGPLPHVRAEWSDARGVIHFDPWGRCTVEATSATLTLRIEAAGDDGLRQIRDVITADLERFGRRDHLAVTWRRSEAPGPDPAA